MPKITYYNGDYKPLSQKLRREMTRQEKHLWYDFLKSYPIPFHRQRQFGHYIVDFYCATAKLVVELDGSQHYEPEAEQRDADRDHHLSALGLTVLRFGNYDVERHFDSVCATIDKAVKQSLNTIQPSPGGQCRQLSEQGPLSAPYGGTSPPSRGRGMRDAVVAYSWLAPVRGRAGTAEP